MEKNRGLFNRREGMQINFGLVDYECICGIGAFVCGFDGAADYILVCFVEF